MIVMVDTNFLIALVNDNNQYRAFIQQLERQNMIVGIPTPVLAEFLVRDQNLQRQELLNKLSRNVQIFSFDTKAAWLCARMMREFLALKSQCEDGLQNTRQVIKVDMQILAITQANNINRLLSKDDGMSKIIKLLDLNIETVSKKNWTSQPDLF